MKGAEPGPTVSRVIGASVTWLVLVVAGGVGIWTYLAG